MSVVSEVKELSERSQMFHFNQIEVKQCRQHSQRFYFKSRESRTSS